MPVGPQSWTIQGAGINGPFFNTGAPGAPWSARVFNAGGSWLISETSGQLLFAFNLPLTYNAGTGLWTWTGILNCACFPFAPITCTFVWDPTAVASAATLRNYVDEVRPGPDDLLRWALPLEMLTGSRYVETALATCCWKKSHAIGNYFKLGTQPEARAAGQALRWHW